MFLYAGGCSHAWGSELVHPDDKIVEANATLNNMRLKYVWTGQLASLMGVDYYNDGVPGQSNERIVERLLVWVENWIHEGNDPKDLFVVIGWTTAFRWDFYHQSMGKHRFSIHHGHDPFSDNATDGLKRFWKYYNHVATSTLSQQWHRTAALVATTQAFLDNRGIAYAMTCCAGPSPYEIISRTRDFHNHELEVLDNIDQTKVLGLTDDRNMTDYLYKNGISKTNPRTVAPRGHFFADGHDLWSKYFYDWMVHQGMWSLS